MRVRVCIAVVLKNMRSDYLPTPTIESSVPVVATCRASATSPLSRPRESQHPACVPSRICTEIPGPHPRICTLHPGSVLVLHPAQIQLSCCGGTSCVGAPQRIWQVCSTMDTRVWARGAWRGLTPPAIALSRHGGAACTPGHQPDTRCEHPPTHPPTHNIMDDKRGGLLPTKLAFFIPKPGARFRGISSECKTTKFWGGKRLRFLRSVTKRLLF